MKTQDRYEEEDFSDFLNDLINSGELEDKELGIAKLVLDKGFEKLSKKQKYVFNKDVVEYYYIKECARCLTNIPWSEMVFAYENNNMCSYCDHMHEKIMKE